MQRAARHDEQLSRGELDWIATFKLDAELALPAQEELILVVRVPWELAAQARDAHDRVVRAHEVTRLERLVQGSRGARDVDHVGVEGGFFFPRPRYARYALPTLLVPCLRST